MDNFKDLHQRYIDNSATLKEREEFFLLLDTGAYDHLVAEEMQKVWTNRAMATDDEKQLLAGAYDRIRSIHNPGAAKVVSIEKKGSRVWMAAAAAIVIVLMATVLVIKKEDLFREGSVAQQKTLKPSVYTGKQVVTLPDGTEVIMNAQSKLSYDHTFGVKNREVSFSGEGYFDVKHDASKPFIVHTGKVKTKVLGTAFNINAYPDQRQVTVTVVRGLVQVGDDQQHIYDKISPDEQIVVDVTSSKFEKKQTNVKETLAWQNNFLILQDVDLEKAAKIIGEKFKVQIMLEHEALKKCRIDGTFLEDEPLNEVLDLIGQVLNIEFTMEGDGSVMLRGKGCN